MQTSSSLDHRIRRLDRGHADLVHLGHLVRLDLHVFLHSHDRHRGVGYHVESTNHPILGGRHGPPDGHRYLHARAHGSLGWRSMYLLRNLGGSCDVGTWNGDDVCHRHDRRDGHLATTRSCLS